MLKLVQNMKALFKNIKQVIQLVIFKYPFAIRTMSHWPTFHIDYIGPVIVSHSLIPVYSL